MRPKSVYGSVALMYMVISVCVRLGSFCISRRAVPGVLLCADATRALMQPVRLAACTGCLSAETSRSCCAAAPVHTQCLTIWRWAASRACRVSQLFRDKQAAKQTCRVSRRNYTMLCVCVCVRETPAVAALLSPEMRHARSN